VPKGNRFGASSKLNLKATRNYQGEVIGLLARAEFLDSIEDSIENREDRGILASVDGIEQPSFAELFSSSPCDLCDAVGVNGEDVSCTNLDFTNGTVPRFEEPYNGGGSDQPICRSAGAEENRWVMPTIGVAQPAGRILVVSEKKSGVCRWCSRRTTDLPTLAVAAGPPAP
jgi:hypothetical protein